MLGKDFFLFFKNKINKYSILTKMRAFVAKINKKDGAGDEKY